MLALCLGEEDLVPVVVADDARCPGHVERRERGREVDLVRVLTGGVFQ
jgi:hypothetical protein